MPIHRLLTPTCLLSLLVSVSAANAGEIYKCTINGQVKYQDSPCEAKAKSSSIAIRGSNASGKPASQLSLAEIYTEMRDVDKLRKEIEGDYNADLRRATGRYSGADDREAMRAERERLEAEWRPKLQAVQQRSDELAAELRTRCPKGANLSPGRYRCGK